MCNNEQKRKRVFRYSQLVFSLSGVEFFGLCRLLADSFDGKVLPLMVISHPRWKGRKVDPGYRSYILELEQNIGEVSQTERTIHFFNCERIRDKT